MSSTGPPVPVRADPNPTAAPIATRAAVPNSRSVRRSARGQSWCIPTNRVSAASATLLTRIEQINPIYANFSQSSADLLAIRKEVASGELSMPALRRVAVRLMLEDGSLYDQVGHLNFLDLSIDEATGTTALRAEFPNPSRILLPGQFVRVRVEAGTRSRAMLIPQRAVTVAPQGATVMVVGDTNVVEARAVTVGELRNGSWLILRGLQTGDRVIVDGLQKVQPGQAVRVAEDSVRADTSQPSVASDSGRRAVR